MTVLNEMGYKR